MGFILDIKYFIVQIFKWKILREDNFIIFQSYYKCSVRVLLCCAHPVGHGVPATLRACCMNSTTHAGSGEYRPVHSHKYTERSNPNPVLL